MTQTLELIGGTDEQIANRKKWSAALRSSDYKQAHGALRTLRDVVFDEEEDRVLSSDETGPKECCCLGVVCDISGIGKWNPDAPNVWVIPYHNPDTDYSGYAFRGESMPPPEVQRWVGITDNLSGEFASLNDGQAWTFEMIATLIDILHLVTVEEVQNLDAADGSGDDLKALVELAKERA